MRPIGGNFKKLAIAVLVLLPLSLALRWLLRPTPDTRVFPPGAAAALTHAGISLDRVGRQLLDVTDKNSADTHRRSGFVHGVPYANALDIEPAETPAQRRLEIHRLRMAGFAAWSRGPGEPGGPAGLGPHYHIVWTGAATNLRDNRQQICSFVHHFRGLSHYDRPVRAPKTKSKIRDVSIAHSEVLAIEKTYGSVPDNASHPLDVCRTYEQLH